MHWRNAGSSLESRAMRCPRCLQTMHMSAEECPHCGLTAGQLDHVYQDMSRTVRRPHDAAGVLKVKDRERVARWISRAEKVFPQLYFSVATVALGDDRDLRSYGYWLMNSGEFADIPESAREDGCVLLVIDVNRKEVCLHLGYLLDQYMREDDSFEALAGGHPHLLEANYVKAIKVMLRGVQKYVKRLQRRAKRKARKG